MRAVWHPALATQRMVTPARGDPLGPRWHGTPPKDALRLGSPVPKALQPASQTAAAPAHASPAPLRRQPKLLDRLRHASRARHYSPRTEQPYCRWMRRFIFFHHVQHPAKMGEPELNAFLTLCMGDIARNDKFYPEEPVLLRT